MGTPNWRPWPVVMGRYGRPRCAHGGSPLSSVGRAAIRNVRSDDSRRLTQSNTVTTRTAAAQYLPAYVTLIARPFLLAVPGDSTLAFNVASAVAAETVAFLDR